MTEKELQRRVMRLAKELGWRRFHVKPAPMRNRKGRYITPVDGEAGFPDLVLVRDGRLLFAELKSERGQLSAEQMAWRHQLQQVEASSGMHVENLATGFGVDCRNVQVFVWRPQDWDDGTIEQVLT